MSEEIALNHNSDTKNIDTENRTVLEKNDKNKTFFTKSIDNSAVQSEGLVLISIYQVFFEQNLLESNETGFSMNLTWGISEF